MAKIIISAAILLLAAQGFAGLIINEFVTAAPADWVELKLVSDNPECMDISKLYVTMYYGTNEKLSGEPVTICSYNRSDTPYDDRFVVVHLTEPGKSDETDNTGDINGNGYLDVYCNNYSGSLWNTDGVIAIDSDDDPGNGGIIDFVAYSNRDGSINSTVAGYIQSAIQFNQWTNCQGGFFQDCSVDIGKNGLQSYMSVSRKTGIDTNSRDDFSVTNYPTPGKDNLFSIDSQAKRLFRPEKSKITVSPKISRLSECFVDLYVINRCNIRFRIFSSTGILLNETEQIKSVFPGKFSHKWDYLKSGDKINTGLYICRIEAYGYDSGVTQTETVYIIISRL